MKIIKHNESYLTSAILSLRTISDEDCMYLLKNLDTNDEKEVRSVIKKYVVPTFFKWDEVKQEKIKDTLFYYLATKNIEVLQDTVDEVPIYLPPGYEFFSLVWDELFHEPIPTKLDPDTEYIEEDSTIYISGDEN